MIITPDLIKALFTGFKKNYQDGLQMAKSQYPEIATVVPSSTASNTYGWLGQAPALREWVGDRVFNDMKAHAYAIANKHFAIGAALDLLHRGQLLRLAGGFRQPEQRQHQLLCFVHCFVLLRGLEGVK